jgi:hypothetical protein
MACYRNNRKYGEQAGDIHSTPGKRRGSKWYEKKEGG